MTKIFTSLSRFEDNKHRLRILGAKISTWKYTSRKGNLIYTIHIN